MNEKISIIIPVYNQAEFILAALDSIVKQNWNLIELIIIDDGSTDSLEEVLVTFDHPFIYQKQVNQGPAAARNSGLEIATGSFIAFLDADDVWTEGRLEMMMSYFLDHPEIEGVIGKAVEKNRDTKWYPLLGASLFRRQLFNQVGFFDAELRYSEDQDWFLRAKEKGTQLLAIPEETLLRRVNGKSTTFNKTWSELHIHKVLKMSLDRRRRSSSGNIDNLKTLNSYQRSL